MNEKPTYEELEQRIRDLEEEMVKGKQAEEALRESETRYRGLFENMLNGFAYCQMLYKDGRLDDFIYLDVNKAFGELTGLRNVVGQRVTEVIPGIKEATPELFDIYARVDETGSPERLEIDFTPSGVRLNISIYSPQKGYCVAVFDNITDRKQAEEALRVSEEKYRTILDEIDEGYFEVDLTGKFTFVSDWFLQIAGNSRDELLTMNNRDYMTPESAKKVFNIFTEFLQTGEPVKNVGHEIITPAGEHRHHELSASLIRDREGNPIGFRGTAWDVSERIKAEEALRESEEKYRLLVENADDAIFIAQDEVIKFFNPKTEQMTGFSAEELAEIRFVDRIHPEDRDMVLDRHRRRLTGEDLPGTYSFRIITRDNEELAVDLNTVLISWEGKPATLNLLRDITQQEKLKAQFQQAQRMEALGTLAGGIAHNFNNVLMGIQGRASLMMMDKDGSHRDFEHLKGIKEYVKNATELTKDLLGFARGGKYEPRPIGLNELIKHENLMFGRTRKEITLQGKYNKDLWTVEVDQGQMRQVLMNLYVNAWQAMPGGGDIYVQTENVTVDEGYVKPYVVIPGRYVKISVTDTGVGMDEATREKIFDPFFTTQEMGTGTGLGLASVYGIVKNHGGFINVYSEKGVGTTFNIYLPASEKEVVEEKRPTGEVVKGEGTILFVDDEEMITDVGELLLEKLGYHVLTAKSGQEAIEVYGKNRDDIDLVILDMIMPGMGGGETYDRLKEIKPDIKVLLSSGYSINDQAREILGRGCNGFIQKPFSMSEISQRIREHLDKG